MKALRNKKIFRGILQSLLLIVALLALPLQTKAADSITVTFRSGVLGTIDSDSCYKISVSAVSGTTVAQVITDSQILNRIEVKSADEYYVEPVAKWKISSQPIGTDTMELTKNCDIVVSYGRLIDSAEYNVKYLDIDTGIQVAEPLIGRSGNGTDLTANPLTGIANYVLVSPTNAQTLKLNKNQANEITFYYRSTLKGNVTENVTYQEVPGEVVTTTETINNIIDQPVALAGGIGGNAAGNAVPINDENVPLAGDNQTADTQNDAAASDESTPETDTGNQTDSQVIEDETTPLSDSVESEEISPIILAIVGAVLVVVIAGYIFLRRRMAITKADTGSDDNKDEN